MLNACNVLIWRRNRASERERERERTNKGGGREVKKLWRKGSQTLKPNVNAVQKLNFKHTCTSFIKRSSVIRQNLMFFFVHGKSSHKKWRFIPFFFSLSQRCCCYCSCRCSFFFVLFLFILFLVLAHDWCKYERMFLMPLII